MLRRFAAFICGASNSSYRAQLKSESATLLADIGAKSGASLLRRGKWKKLSEAYASPPPPARRRHSPSLQD